MTIYTYSMIKITLKKTLKKLMKIPPISKIIEFKKIISLICYRIVMEMY